jgi:leader peptidase (prepilin peptidase)/N-methyltransferase
VLGPLELVPVLSWLAQRGRCKSCGAKLSARYPLTELIFALVTVLCLLRFDLTVLCLRNWVFLGCLFLLTLTDLDAMIIPDGCHIVALLAWLAALPFVGMGRGEIITHLVAGVAMGGGLLLISLAMDKIMGRDTMGGGDIKLLFVIGCFLSLPECLLMVMLACLIGICMASILMRVDSETAFPFGPALSIAAIVTMLVGSPIVNWYLSLF